MNFVQNILWNSVSGFVEAGTRTAGGYAGDALIKAGDLIENSGRGIGGTLERRATGLGGTITGQSYTPSGKALPSTARKPAIKRSNSSPAATSTRAIGLTSKTPLGAKKYPVGKQGGAATKQITAGANGARSVAGGVSRGLGGVVGGAASKSTSSLPKPYPDTKPYGKSSLSRASNGLPKPFPGTEKKTAVRPGQSKPFEASKPRAGAEAEKKAYPGTNTYPGQGSKTPVRAQKYKPMDRMKAPAEKGKAQHITV